MVCKRKVESIMVAPNTKQLEHTKNEINEDEDRLKHNESLINEWIKCQNHFPKNVDPCYIRSFLRGCRHNLDKTKKKLEYHLSAKHLYPEMYNRSPYSKDIVKAMDTLNISFMPKLTDEGNRIFIFALERNDAADFDLVAASKLFFMLYDFLLTSESPISGDIAIFDAGNFGPAHFTKFLGPFMKSLTVLLREAYAIRLKQIHVVNAPPMFEKVLAVIKPMMHQKVRNTFVMHKSNQDLVNYFGAELLPSNYGGNLKSHREISQESYDLLNDNAEWFEAQENMKIIGGIPKKIENCLYFKEELGVEGSFRKLEID